jgi:GDP-4-dehydro-6-deoxy-D-mannose reductase
MDEAVSGQPLRTLFVTGGHGFVGQWVQRLAGEIASGFGFAVAIPSTGFDLLDATQVDEELARHRPDAILHLAGQSNVPLSFKDPEGTLRVNLLGTLRLFEGIKRAGLAPRVVFASSGDVYGKVPEDEMPVGEDRIPHPRNPYAVSKLATESLCYQWSQTEGLEVMIARPFNHVGAGQSDGFVLPYFARQIAEIRAKRRPARIEVGNIDVSRDFTHVADVVNAYLTLVEKGIPGETYNIASGVDRVVRDLLLRMLELAGVEVEITEDPDRMRHAEQRVVRGANAKIERLGWRPTRSIEMALTEILDEWERKTSNE